MSILLVQWPLCLPDLAATSVQPLPQDEVELSGRHFHNNNQVIDAVDNFLEVHEGDFDKEENECSLTAGVSL